MGAPEGNQFWRKRTKHGRDKLFKSDDDLWDACCEYFQWVEDNPLFEDKLVTFQGSATHEPVSKMRAMTINGLCIHLDIDRSTWTAWKTDKDFSSVVKRTEAIIYEQKFTGAAAELLNPNIIARDLGLSDKVDNTSSDGSMTPKGVVVAKDVQDVLDKL